jgi:hypothetical protein
MTKIILAMALTLVALQAEDTVHYDIKPVKKPEISKPNYPTGSLYTK